MSNYCPACYNPALQLKSRGVIELIVDDKQMDSGRFLFNSEMNEREVEKHLVKKIEEFMRWYSNFNNKKPIEKISILTNAIACTNKCSLPISFKGSVLDYLLDRKKVMEMIKKSADANGIELHPDLSL
ncbi:MAG: hypothetical protein ACPGJV_14350 [Bacteriovoracaceae bacterium]